MSTNLHHIHRMPHTAKSSSKFLMSWTGSGNPPTKTRFQDGALSWTSFWVRFVFKTLLQNDTTRCHSNRNGRDTMLSLPCLRSLLLTAGRRHRFAAAPVSRHGGGGGFRVRACKCFLTKFSGSFHLLFRCIYLFQPNFSVTKCLCGKRSFSKSLFCNRLVCGYIFQRNVRELVYACSFFTTAVVYYHTILGMLWLYVFLTFRNVTHAGINFIQSASRCCVTFKFYAKEAGRFFERCRIYWTAQTFMRCVDMSVFKTCL